MNKISRRTFLKLGVTAGAALAVPWSVFAQTPPPPQKIVPPHLLKRKVKPADRKAAADRLNAMGVKAGAASGPKAMDPGGIPHYYGPYANYANSPMPTGGIARIIVDAGGSGYSATPTVTIDDVYGTGYVQPVANPPVPTATASANVVGGKIVSIDVLTAGVGYTAPIVTITDATGTGAAATAVLGSLTGGIRKFVDSLPGLVAAGGTASTLAGKYLQLATAETWTDGASDYYEIALVEFNDQFHRDLPATRLRGYVQLVTPTNTVATPWPLVSPVDGSPILKPDGTPAMAMDQPRYLGPLILAHRDRPVRIKFYNLLPTGAGGDLFIPVDESVMGAGEGPTPIPATNPVMYEKFKQNRATLHLHGGLTPWISDGTPHQWTTPANETTSYPKGVSTYNVPDMPLPGKDPSPGTMTFYYTNAQSARLMFYHDHAYGITRLNVYAGEAAGYLLSDGVEEDLMNGTNLTGVNPNLLKVLPGYGIPLIIQDKTFVDATTIPAQDPTWNWGITPGTPHTGDLWVPSVYMPAQNPWDPTGANAFGRWQYGPYFWPPTAPTLGGLVANPYYDPINAPWEPPMNPIMPRPSMGMEAFNDTPIVNGLAYPYLEVDPTLVRFRILSAANDRFFNLHFYVADPNFVDANGFPTEVKMVPALANPAYPPTWSADGRAGGVPDPFTAGPSWIQLGTEGGFLPEPVVIPPQPLNWNMNATAFNVGNVTDHSLLLGPAERADVLVDFSQFAGQTLIMYNDAPAAFPALDPRYDYYTGTPDQTSSGGAPTTQPGYGPNVRTVMQVRVKGNVGAGGPLASVTVTNGGQDYDQSPKVVFTGGGLGAVQAVATATGAVAQIDVVQPGDGTLPAVVDVAVNPAVGDTTGGGATATATVVNGYITGIVVTNGGSGFTLAPDVVLSVGGVPISTAIASAVSSLTITAVTLDPLQLGTYTSLPQVSLLGGGGNGAAAMATFAAGTAFNLADLVNVWKKDKATSKRGVFEVSQDPIILPQAAYNTAYDTAFSPVVADQYIQQQDFSKTFTSHIVASLTLVSGGAGYPPSSTVNGVFTLGGGGSGAAATATVDASGVITSVTLTNPGNGYTSAPTVDFPGGTTAAVVNANLAAFANLAFEPKAIHDEMNAAYDVEYGRMSGLLGLELPVVNALNQNLVLYGYATPPVDLLQDSISQMGTLGDGTQIWKITHNGVDTHPIHFHLVNVQLINRMAWDGALLPPEPNEIGWKETVRINPLEHTIVAMRPVAPPIPFDLPNSIRPIDVTMPLDTPVKALPPGLLDPTGLAAALNNHPVNYGWEYVWHCHILSHEEMDMMHALSLVITPKAPSNLSGVLQGAGNNRRVVLTWVNNSLNATGFQIERASNSSFTTGLVTFNIVDVTGSVTTYTDTNNIQNNTPYYYRVRAVNTIGDTTVFANGAAFPTKSLISGPSNVAALAPPEPPINVTVTQPGPAGSAVIVSWTDNSTNETFFTVQRSNNGVSGWTTLTTTVAGSVPPSLTGGVFTYPNTGTQRNRTYFYRVLARNAFGTGAPSNPPVSITTKP